MSRGALCGSCDALEPAVSKQISNRKLIKTHFIKQSEWAAPKTDLSAGEFWSERAFAKEKQSKMEKRFTEKFEKI